MVGGQMSEGHVYSMDCIPVIEENSTNTWIAVLGVCLCYKMLLENMHVMEQNANQQREWTVYPSLYLERWR